MVVEDEKKVASFLKKGLEEEYYAVDCAYDGEEALYMVEANEYDLMILDIMLPKIDGLEVVKGVRDKGFPLPVLMLTAKDSVEDVVKGLDAGGDDYLTKPFAFAELLARVQALIRRTSQIAEPMHLEVNDLYLNLLTREVMRDKRRIELQPKEFSLLEYLMRNKGRVVSKTMIVEHVWGYNFDPQTNVVEARMSKLRDKIDKDARVKLIHTIRGVGYVLR